LSVIYPLAFKWPVLQIVLALFFLAGLSLAALMFWKSRPYWLV